MMRQGAGSATVKKYSLASTRVIRPAPSRSAWRAASSTKSFGSADASRRRCAPFIFHTKFEQFGCAAFNAFRCGDSDVGRDAIARNRPGKMSLFVDDQMTSRTRRGAPCFDDGCNRDAPPLLAPLERRCAQLVVAQWLGHLVAQCVSVPNQAAVRLCLSRPRPGW